MYSLLDDIPESWNPQPANEDGWIKVRAVAEISETEGGGQRLYAVHALREGSEQGEWEWDDGNRVHFAEGPGRRDPASPEQVEITRNMTMRVPFAAEAEMEWGRTKAQ